MRNKGKRDGKRKDRDWSRLGGSKMCGTSNTIPKMSHKHL